MLDWAQLIKKRASAMGSLKQFCARHRFLLRWCVLFALANTLLTAVVSINYFIGSHEIPFLQALGWQGRAIEVAFVSAALLGHFALLCFSGGAVLLLLTLCLPKARFVIPLGTLLAAGFLSYLLFDSFLFHLFHYHFVGAIWPMLFSGSALQIFDLSNSEILSAFFVVLVAFAVQWMLARWLWRRVTRLDRVFQHTMPASLLFGGALFCSYMLALNTVQVSYKQPVAVLLNHIVSLSARSIPLYNDILGVTLGWGQGSERLQRAGESLFMQPAQYAKPLAYPLHALQCVAPPKPYNVLVIGLDAWRFDMLQQKVSPNIWALAQNSWRFTSHFSGGDGTQPGLFSLFYGIPANYWTATQRQHQGALLIHQMLKNNYQTKVLMSAEMHYPAFGKTIFSEVRHLRLETPGVDSASRDQRITDDFLTFLKRRDHYRPFFGFLFYDESHSYCDSKMNYAHPFLPVSQTCDRLSLSSSTDPAPYLNRYKNAIHYDDALIGKILDQLKKQDLLKNTIVMVTSDHGEEFNENGLGYWGHTSNFTKYQTQVPLVIHWPGAHPAVVNHVTSHYDVVPTLMTRAFGCSNPIADYSVGTDLLQPGRAGQRDALLISSYIDFAIVTPKTITTLFPSGNYEVDDLHNRPLLEAHLDTKVLQHSMGLMKKYFSE